MSAGGPERPRDAGVRLLDEKALTAWGKRIGASVEVPVILALHGELGAGKSVLARGVARGAGVRGPIPSPTFNLMFRYSGERGVDVVHLDLFRLERPEEVLELGWHELGDGREIVVMEWPEKAERLLLEPRWDIYLEVADPATRRVRAVPRGVVPELPG